MMMVFIIQVESEELVIEYEMADGDVVVINLDEEPINSRLSDLEKLESMEKLQAIREMWISNIKTARTSEEAASAYENAIAAMSTLERETGITLDPIQYQMDLEQEDAEEYMEEQELDGEEKDDGYGDYIDHYGRNFEER